MSLTPSRSRWSSIPITLSNLTLANTLPVGQSFLWHRHPIQTSEAEAGPSKSPLEPEPEPTEEFSRAVDNPPRVVRLRQTPTQLQYSVIYPNTRSEELDKAHTATTAWLKDYFQLDHDLDALYSEWSKRDPDMFGKIDISGKAVGVRLLRQDPWECLVAFITSTNNHISRITSLMHKFTQRYSAPLLTYDDRVYHLFPSPHTLPTELEGELRLMGFGYRASFLESSLATLRQEFGNSPGAIEAGLGGWRTGEMVEVREKLLGLKGVGRKVADCVMLMCLDRLSLIPIDTHLTAIAARHPSFPGRLKNKTMSKQIYEETQEFLEDKWGPLGGWAQAVMFAADLKPASTNTTPKKKSGMISISSLTNSTSPRSSVKPEWPPSSSMLEDASPLKRKSEVVESKRTRSATRLSIRRTESDLIVDDLVDKLRVEPEPVDEVKGESKGHGHGDGEVKVEPGVDRNVK